jgi:hypothetical protein
MWVDHSLTPRLPNSPTPQLAKSPSSQLASLSAAATDVMMQMGSCHHVICCLCATRGRLVFVKCEGGGTHRALVLGGACMCMHMPQPANSPTHFPVRMVIEPHRILSYHLPLLRPHLKTPRLPNSLTHLGTLPHARPILQCSRSLTPGPSYSLTPQLPRHTNPPFYKPTTS